MEFRRRRQRQTGVHEPLLEDENETSTNEVRGSSQQSKAIVPLSVNRVDWEALWWTLANACKVGWANVRQRLENLQRRIKVGFDKEDSTHQDALKQLWGFAFPGQAYSSLYGDSKWTEMGWQQNDPSTDFRGAGFIALENLLFLAQDAPALFQSLLHKTNGSRSDWEYPFAVAGVNLTFMMQEILDLRRKDGGVSLHTPATAPGIGFLHLLEDDAKAFDKVYCLAFEMLDRTWLEMGASYMDFTSVINRVKSQLQSALESQPRSMEGFEALVRP